MLGLTAFRKANLDAVTELKDERQICVNELTGVT